MSDIEDRLRAALHDETAELSARPELADDMVSHGMSVRRRRRAAVGIAGVAVLAALFPVWKAIDTSSGPIAPSSPLTPTVVSQSTPTTPTTPTTPRQTTTSTSGLPPYSAQAVDVSRAPASPPRVVNVRVAGHGSYDRIVIDLDGDLTGYRVETVTQMVEDGSGDPVLMPGNALLAVRISPADAHDPATGESVFTADTEQSFTLPSVGAVWLVSDYEGTVTLGVGLTHASTFRVFDLESPSRIVIDVHH